MSTLVRLRGIAGTRIDDAGNRKRTELLGTGEDYSAAYADIEHRVPQGFAPAPHPARGRRSRASLTLPVDGGDRRSGRPAPVGR